MTSPGAYTMRIQTPLPFDVALARARECLVEQGFGVLTEIDVRQTLRDKLGFDVPDQVILGACRPQLAHRAMEAVPSIATLLPCNVVVRDDGDHVVVEAIDPEVMSRLEDRSEILQVAGEARVRLRTALDRIALQET